jgi:hypothetical protein
MVHFDFGQVVRSTVTRVEPFGMYLDYNGASILVDGNEVSWIPKPRWWETIQRGDGFDVAIIGFNYEHRHWIGSLRRAHQDSNPFLALFRLDPDQVLRGRIARLAPDILVTLEVGCIGRITGRNLPKYSNREEVLVRIRFLSVDLSEVELAPVEVSILDLNVAERQ